MQIKCLAKNLYRFYAWSRSQECLDAYRREIEQSVRAWESLRTEGVSESKCAGFTGISRSSYYRRRARLKDLAHGCTASTTLSGSDNHFGRFLSRCDATYFVVSWAVISCVLVTGDVVAGAFA